MRLEHFNIKKTLAHRNVSNTHKTQVFASCYEYLFIYSGRRVDLEHRTGTGTIHPCFAPLLSLDDDSLSSLKIDITVYVICTQFFVEAVLHIK